MSSTIAAHIRQIASPHRIFRSFIGMGYYPCAVPAAVARNVFENPAWYTSYTPYQAEISQGRLEALLNFQTAVISLTGMEIGNCFPLLDEGTAAAEAMLMMYALRSREAVKEGRNQLFVDRNLFPQTLDVLLTRSDPLRHRAHHRRIRRATNSRAGVRRHRPVPGRRRRGARLRRLHRRGTRQGALVTAVCDLLSLALLKAPGEWGADIAVGSTQRLGIPMGFGGPSGLYDHARSLQAQHAGPHHRRLGRPAGQPRPCAWRSRCASSTSSASAPPRTSAPPRP